MKSNPIAKNIIEEKKINNVLENICHIYFKRNSKSKFLKEKKLYNNLIFLVFVGYFYVKEFLMSKSKVSIIGAGGNVGSIVAY